MAGSEEFCKKLSIALYTVILYASIVVFGQIADIRTSNGASSIDTSKGNWVLSAGVISAFTSIAMIAKWVFVPEIAKKLNVAFALFLTVWWAAGAGVATQIGGSSVFVGFSFVASVASSVLFVFEAATLVDRFRSSTSKEAVIDEGEA